jgi:hypothetical protein
MHYLFAEVIKGYPISLASIRLLPIPLQFSDEVIDDISSTSAISASIPM